MRCRYSIAFSSCKEMPYPDRDAVAEEHRLLFMTYNGWVMLAVAVGAFVGYLAFGNSTSTKSVACH